MKIESLDQDIRNLLSSGYYRIPRFQRPYSWTRENIQEFWDDIVRENPSDYFIGSMVVFKDGNQRYGVVDGQQRLTTIIVMLAIIRNFLKASGFNDLANGIHGLIERKNIDNIPEYVLSTETSFPFFQEHILKLGEPELEPKDLQEEENLKNAFDQFKSLVGDVIKSIKSDTMFSKESQKENIKKKLIDIRDRVLNLKIIFVKLDEEDDAYVIFETLNTRGKDLSLADLVKNHITKHLKAKSASVDSPKVKWERILETIEGSSYDLRTDTFIHHFWLSRYEYLPSKNIFKAIKSRVGKNEAKGFLDDLVSDCSLYRGIHDIKYLNWTKQEGRIPESLNALQLFRVQQQTPCVLSLIRSCKQKIIKSRHLEQALVAIEKFHFLFTAVTSQRSSGGISQMYASLGRRIYGSDDMRATLILIKELKGKLRERIPSFKEVEALFPEIVYTNRLSKQRGLVKYILSSFNKSDSLSMPADFDAMTIEHLVPQSKIGESDFSEAIVGQVGNLILVSEALNQRLRNKAFNEKKRILILEGYQLPHDIADADEWEIDNIRNRTQNMAKKAYNEIWRI